MVAILLPNQSKPLRVVAPPPPPPAAPKPKPPPKPRVIPPPEVEVAAREQTFPEALADAMTRSGEGTVVGIPGEKGPPVEAPPAVVNEIVQVAVAAPPVKINFAPGLAR